MPIQALSVDALLLPQWPVPPQVRAVFSTRQGGVSGAPYDSLNLGSHVGDDAAAVAAAWFVTGRGTPASLRPVTDGVVVAPVPPPLAGAATTVVSVHEVRLERAFPGWGLL